MYWKQLEVQDLFQCRCFGFPFSFRMTSYGPESGKRWETDFCFQEHKNTQRECH